jgi:glycine betaine catabolism B
MRIRLVRVVDEAKNIKTFWFEPESPLRYQAGQFIEMIIPHEDADKRGVRHWFTLSSSPTENLISITTKFPDERPSSFKSALGALNTGDSVMISEAMGDFVLPKDASRPLVFIAGGIGATPMRSMIKYLQDKQEHRTIEMIYAARTIEEVAFRELFSDYGVPLTIVLSEPPKKWPGETGPLTAQKVLNIAPAVDDKLYYMSGPEPMVESLFKEMAGLGVSKRHMITDYFPGYAKF